MHGLCRDGPPKIDLVQLFVVEPFAALFIARKI
jgi:hypothetical protein